MAISSVLKYVLNKCFAIATLSQVNLSQFDKYTCPNLYKILLDYDSAICYNFNMNSKFRRPIL